MTSKKSYGKKMGGWRGIRGGHKKKKSDGKTKSAPFRGGLDRREISLKHPGQVRNAEEIGALKVDKEGGVKPVKGRTHVSDGRLYYNPPR